MHERIRSIKDYQEFQYNQKKWTVYNRECLRHSFSSKDYLDEYNNIDKNNTNLGSISEYKGYKHIRNEEDSVMDWMWVYGRKEEIDLSKEIIGEKTALLDSILEQLNFIPEAVGVIVKQPSAPQKLTVSQPKLSEDVFIVHGHDEAAKQSVARFVGDLGFNAVILDEQANMGKVVVEKFEHNARNAGFAIILMTPDDVSIDRDNSDNLLLRARQNVILELGYFWGALGRDRVMILRGKDVEMPSDFAGVVYEPLEGKAWRSAVAQELKAAGFSIDMNKVW